MFTKLAQIMCLITTHNLICIDIQDMDMDGYLILMRFLSILKYYVRFSFKKTVQNRSGFAISVKSSTKMNPI